MTKHYQQSTMQYMNTVQTATVAASEMMKLTNKYARGFLTKSVLSANTSSKKHNY